MLQYNIIYVQGGKEDTIVLHGSADAAHFAFHMICEDHETSSALLQEADVTLSQYQRNSERTDNNVRRP